MQKIYLLNSKIDTFDQRDELLALSLFENDNGHYFDLSDLKVKELHRKLFPSAATQTSEAKCLEVKPAVPREKWPTWTKAIEALRSDGDIGIGDTIERLAGAAGRTFKMTFKTITGRPCGCAGRRDAFNSMYPYAFPLNPNPLD